MPTMRLTEIVARTARAIEGRQVTLWDSSLPGFGTAHWCGGEDLDGNAWEGQKATYAWSDPIMGLQAARLEAKRLMLANAVVRNDPNIIPITFSEALRKFVELRLPQKRESTAKEYERILRKHFEPLWRNRAITDISRRDIHHVLDGLTATPAMANNALQLSGFSVGGRCGEDIWLEARVRDWRHLASLPRAIEC